MAGRYNLPLLSHALASTDINQTLAEDHLLARSYTLWDEEVGQGHALHALHAVGTRLWRLWIFGYYRILCSMLVFQHLQDIVGLMSRRVAQALYIKTQ